MPSHTVKSSVKALWPVGSGEVFLLLELLLQAQELQLREDGAAAAGFLQSRGGVLRLWLAADADGGLAVRGLGGERVLGWEKGQVWRLRLVCDHGEERVRSQRGRAWGNTVNETLLLALIAHQYWQTLLAENINEEATLYNKVTLIQIFNSKATSTTAPNTVGWLHIPLVCKPQNKIIMKKGSELWKLVSATE